jgi:hypothetical protein
MCMILWVTLACDGGGGDSDTGSDDSGSSTVETGMLAQGCTSTIVLGRYHSDQCQPGEEFGTITLELTEPCGSWTRDAPGGTKTDSFTRIQCYRDRLCFTVHPGSATCEPGADDADVGLMAGDCQRDKSADGVSVMNNFTKILGGIEDCPEPPPGFACPDSAIGDGTPGVLACSAEIP